VLEDMREARSEPLGFVDAAGGTPDLDAGNRRAVILLHDEGKTVLE
jgi:hypothetical protein